MTSKRITAPTARAAANLISRLRHRSGGVDWQAPGIEAALLEAGDMADEDELVIAMIRAAREPVNRTPGIIAHPGPHWREAEVVRYPTPKTADLCAVCGAEDGPIHPRDHVFARRRHREPTSREQAAAAAAAAKAAHQAAKALKCRHGVIPGRQRCAVCEAERPDPQPLDALLPDEGEPVPVAP